jgi:hypothetical protein
MRQKPWSAKLWKKKPIRNEERVMMAEYTITINMNICKCYPKKVERR